MPSSSDNVHVHNDIESHYVPLSGETSSTKVSSDKTKCNVGKAFNAWRVLSLLFLAVVVLVLVALGVKYGSPEKSEQRLTNLSQISNKELPSGSEQDFSSLSQTSEKELPAVLGNRELQASATLNDGKVIHDEVHSSDAVIEKKDEEAVREGVRKVINDLVDITASKVVQSKKDGTVTKVMEGSEGEQDDKVRLAVNKGEETRKEEPIRTFEDRELITPSTQNDGQVIHHEAPVIVNGSDVVIEKKDEEVIDKEFREVVNDLIEKFEYEKDHLKKDRTVTIVMEGGEGEEDIEVRLAVNKGEETRIDERIHEASVLDKEDAEIAEEERKVMNLVQNVVDTFLQNAADTAEPILSPEATAEVPKYISASPYKYLHSINDEVESTLVNMEEETKYKTRGEHIPHRDAIIEEIEEELESFVEEAEDILDEEEEEEEMLEREREAIREGMARTGGGLLGKMRGRAVKNEIELKRSVPMESLDVDGQYVDADAVLEGETADIETFNRAMMNKLMASAVQHQMLLESRFMMTPKTDEEEEDEDELSVSSSEEEEDEEEVAREEREEIRRSEEYADELIVEAMRLLNE